MKYKELYETLENIKYKLKSMKGWINAALEKDPNNFAIQQIEAAYIHILHQITHEKCTWCNS